MANNITRDSVNLPAAVSAEIIQKMQEQSAVMQLSRQITLPGSGIVIPVITGDPTASWVGESKSKPVSNAKVETKKMQAYKLAVIETFSEEFTRDAEALYEALIARLPLALAKQFDATVFGAVDAPGENFDTLKDCTAQEIGKDTYAGLVAADADIAAHDGILNGFVLSPQAKSVLLSAVDGNKRPLFVNSVSEGAIPMVLGSATHQSKGAHVAGNPETVGFAGDWTQAVYGTVEGVKIKKSEEATLKIGNETVNLFQDNMVAVLAEIELGFRCDKTVFNRLTRTNA